MVVAISGNSATMRMLLPAGSCLVMAAAVILVLYVLASADHLHRQSLNANYTKVGRSDTHVVLKVYDQDWPAEPHACYTCCFDLARFGNSLDIASKWACSQS